MPLTCVFTGNAKREEIFLPLVFSDERTGFDTQEQSFSSGLKKKSKNVARIKFCHKFDHLVKLII